MKLLRLALAQTNPTVGDLRGNADAIIRRIREARNAGADIVAFPELALTGYPPEDLVLKPGFVADNLSALGMIAKQATTITAIAGFVDSAADIYNAAAVMHGGRLCHVYRKRFLPNYGVFDEYRYFRPGAESPVYDVGGCLVGVNICEDIWYPGGPAREQALAGAEIIINISASPYIAGRLAPKETMLATRAMDNNAMLAYVNMVGGQDEVLFDGGSVVFNHRGEPLARAERFREDMLVMDLDLEEVRRSRMHDTRRRQESGAQAASAPISICAKPRKKAGASSAMLRPRAMPEPLGAEQEIYDALVLGVTDYVRKNGFSGAIIGISGGVDSALVAAIATDALGFENVRCVFMPSAITGRQSTRDARELARNLNLTLSEISIAPILDRYTDTLGPAFRGRPADVTEENLQARIRGNLLMALSNKLGGIVLTTGNKSEMSVGYATLYGDMAGGFAVIKDVPKTTVYALARYRNWLGLAREGRNTIPENILVKAPTAELRPNQKDTDSLPPYDVLDPILKAYIEEDRSVKDIVRMLGVDDATVRKVVRLVDRSEYKRRQSPPGIKITPRALGKDWRVPITNGYVS